MGTHAFSAWLWALAFVVVMVATVCLVWAVFFAPSRRRRVRGSEQPLPLKCPTCRRAFPQGTQYCPIDAARLQPNVEGAAGVPPGRGGKCPRCRRVFEVGMRFCPMDAEELVPLTAFQSHGEGGAGLHAETFADHLVLGTGKICPVCASKYDLAAGYCGRDASELVTVN